MIGISYERATRLCDVCVVRICVGVSMNVNIRNLAMCRKPYLRVLANSISVLRECGFGIYEHLCLCLGLGVLSVDSKCVYVCMCKSH